MAFGGVTKDTRKQVKRRGGGSTPPAASSRKKKRSFEKKATPPIDRAIDSGARRRPSRENTTSSKTNLSPSALHLRVARGGCAVLRRVASRRRRGGPLPHGDLLGRGRVHGVLRLLGRVGKGPTRLIARIQLDVLLGQEAAADGAPEDVGDAVQELGELVDLLFFWGAFRGRLRLERRRGRKKCQTLP